MPADVFTITAAAAGLNAGAFTAVGLLETCLRRVENHEPAVRAWAYLDAAFAREEAKRCDAERKAGDPCGPLHGIPVGVKDIIDVADTPTACGSALWATSVARTDAACVAKLRAAGAVILGKTVTTPYAFTDPAPTRNPWDRTRTPGGSSSGSAAAVACGMCLGAIGTQTGGSLTRPAAYCGVCSLKPGYGRVSGRGVLPLAGSLDHVGVMANCVRDLAILFEAIAGPDSHDRRAANNAPVPDCLRRLDREPVMPPELVRLGGMFDEMHPELVPFYEATLARIADEGSVPDAVVPPAGFAHLRLHRALMATEAAAVHSNRLPRPGADYPPNILTLVREGLAVPGPVVAAAMKLQRELAAELDAMLAHRRFFVTPATTDLPPPAATTGDPRFNVPWSFTGLPTVGVPAGWTPGGLPFAVQLAGTTGDEHELLAAALYLERDVFRFARRPVPE